jgi:hypothetical protein
VRPAGHYQEATKRVSELDGEIEKSDKGELITKVLAELPLSSREHSAPSSSREHSPIYLTIRGLRMNIRPVLDLATDGARYLSKIVADDMRRARLP